MRYDSATIRRHGGEKVCGEHSAPRQRGWCAGKDPQLVYTGRPGILRGTMSAFQGQVALVTGGGATIGFAISHRRARDGAAVAIVDASHGAAVEAASSLERKFGTRALGVSADVSDESQLSAALHLVARTFSEPDNVFNNAGIMTPRLVSTEDLRADEFDRMIAVRLRGTFLVSRGTL